MWDFVFHGEEGAAQVGVQYSVEFVGGVLVERLLNGDARVVECDVESAVALGGGVDEVADVGFDEDVGVDVGGLALPVLASSIVRLSLSLMPFTLAAASMRRIRPRSGPGGRSEEEVLLPAEESRRRAGAP
ncbi:hypothetical protein GCM10027262_07120 [Nocardia tengchongensis]